MINPGTLLAPEMTCLTARDTPGDRQPNLRRVEYRRKPHRQPSGTLLVPEMAGFTARDTRPEIGNSLPDGSTAPLKAHDHGETVGR